MTDKSDVKVELDMEGIVVPEVLKKRVLVVDSMAAAGPGLMDAIRKAAAEGKEMVVVDSISELKPDDAIAFKPRPDVEEPIPEKRQRPLWDKAKADNRMATDFIAAAASMVGMATSTHNVYGLMARGYTEPKPVKCGLPECEEETTHNGGYCCSEHCREHRRRQKESRKS